MKPDKCSLISLLCSQSCSSGLQTQHRKDCTECHRSRVPPLQDNGGIWPACARHCWGPRESLWKRCAPCLCLRVPSETIQPAQEAEKPRSALLYVHKARRSTKKGSRKHMNGDALWRQSASVSILSSPGSEFCQTCQYTAETELQRGHFSPENFQLRFVKWAAGETHTHEKHHFSVNIAVQKERR